MSGLLNVLLGVMVIGALTESSREKTTERSRLPAPAEPKPVPSKARSLLAARRVHEWRRSIVDEHGVEQSAMSYAPTDSPRTAPWVVTAWYDSKRDAEIIRVEFNWATPADANVHFAVLWNGALNPNRATFRTGATQLWPDDKWNDRVVYRYSGRKKEAGCFLIDVTVGKETIDFFHESLRPEPTPEIKTIAPEPMQAIEVDASALETTVTPAPPPTSALAADFKAYWGVLGEIRAMCEELEKATLHEDDKKELGKFIEQRRRDASAKHMRTGDADNYFAAQR